MAYAKAIIDLGSRQELAQALPPEADIDQSKAPLYFVNFSHNGRSIQLFIYELLRNQSRWIGVVAGPRRAITQLAVRLPATGKVRELTRELYLANRTAFTNLGLDARIRNGREVFRLPHAVCGQSPWVGLEDE